jgi:TatD DNase family protein
MQYINLHSHNNTNDDLTIVNCYAKEWSKQIPYYYSIGVHPWYIEAQAIANELEIITTALQDKNCLALGECGLDKLATTNFELQKKVFIKQLTLAEKYNKPVIIHCVKAFDELLIIKKQFPNILMIIHGFSKSNALAKQLQKHGFYLSFGIHMLKHPDILADLTITKIFLETDDAAIKIDTIYNETSKVLNITTEQLEKQLIKNFKNVFS